jgi:hypothetical protein
MNNGFLLVLALVYQSLEQCQDWTVVGGLNVATCAVLQQLELLGLSRLEQYPISPCRYPRLRAQSQPSVTFMDDYVYLWINLHSPSEGNLPYACCAGAPMNGRLHACMHVRK